MAGWWAQVQLSARVTGPGLLGQPSRVDAQVHGADPAADIRVELLYRHADSPESEPLRTVRLEEQEPDGEARTFAAEFLPELSGRLVYGVRVVPESELLHHAADAGFLTWAKAD